MKRLLEPLDRLPFRRVVWMFPLVFLLHEAEEWNIMGWYEQFFIERPASALSVRIWLVLVTVDIFLVTWLCTRLSSERLVAFLMLPVIGMAGANGLEHLFWVIYFQAYAPGVIFGGLVGVPVAVYLFHRAVSGRLVPAWYALIFAGYALVTLALAYRAGATMPPLIRLITWFSDWAARVGQPWLSG